MKDPNVHDHMSQTAGHCHQHPGQHGSEPVAKRLVVYVFREILGCFFLVVFDLFFTQMRSNLVSISVSLPQDPQASSTVIFQYSRELTRITAVPIGHVFHPHPASQATLYTGPVTARSPWRNLGELLKEKNKQTTKKKNQPVS